MEAKHPRGAERSLSTGCVGAKVGIAVIGCVGRSIGVNWVWQAERC